ncbi:unnamed protein product, partial [Polarella glacialis]
MPMKRPAASSGATTTRAAAAKKQRAAEEDPVVAFSESVQQGLYRSTEAPAGVIQMLTSMTESALRSGKDERHRYQTGVVSMIGTLLSGVEQDIEKTVAELNSKLAGSDLDRERRTAAVKAAEQDLEHKKAATDAQKYKLADDAQ